MTWTWYACDLRTGAVNVQLPLEPSGTLDRGICDTGSTSLTLALADSRCPAWPEWAQATEPARTLLVLDQDGTLVWGGIVRSRTRTQDPVVTLNVSTPESYLLGRYVDTAMTWTTGTDQMRVIRDLIGAANVSGIGLVIDAPDSGWHLPDTTYQRWDDKQVLQLLEDANEAEHGPEWTIDLDWTPGLTGRRVRLTFRARVPYLGKQLDRPDWTFTAPGNVTGYELVEDYTDGKYANVVVAGGEGEDAGRIMSTSAIAQDTDSLAAGNALVEYRHATQLTTQETVDSAALGMLATLRRGARTMRLDARIEPDTFTAWRLGDTCRVVLAGGGFPPEHPYDQVWRVRGWSLDLAADTISPVLVPWADAELI